MNVVKILTGRRRVTEVPSRYLQILYTLGKYGFAQFVTYLPFYKRLFGRLRKTNKKHHGLLELSLGEKLRSVAIDLGPTFIKFGQLLSSRKDLIPSHILKELELLQDKVPEFSSEEAKQRVEESLGRPVSELFRDFSDEPEAAASLAQVHRATLPSGRKVAVKIKRPGIDNQIEADLEIMRRLGHFVDKNTNVLKPLSVIEMVEEFSRQITRELDFKNELLNIQKFRKASEDDDAVIIPRPYEKYTTKDVLVLDFVDGKNVKEVINSTGLKYDKSLIVRRAADFLFSRMLFEGLFHADPHPGNLFILEDSRICLIDFGIVYSFHPYELEQLNYLMLGFGRLDPTLVGRSILKLAVNDTSGVNEREFQRALHDFLESHLNKPLEYIEASRAFIDLLRLVIGFGIRVPSRLVYVAKVFSTLESMGQDLDPDFHVIEFVRSLSPRIWINQFGSHRVRDKLTVSALNWTDAALRIPETIDDARQFLRDRSFTVGMPDMLSIRETIDKVGFRMVFGLVLAAVLVSSSLVVLAGVGPMIGDIPIFGFIGFGIGLGMGVMFLFSAIYKMLRWRKRK